MTRGKTERKTLRSGAAQPVSGAARGLFGPAIDAIGDSEQITTDLPDGGRLHLDRRLPYLLVYRRPPGGDDAGTEALVRGEASYAILDGATPAEEYRPLLRAIVRAGTAEFGAFLLLELWSGPEGSREYRVQGPREEGAETIAALAESLRTLRAANVATEVVVESAIERHPEEMEALLTPRACKELACLSVGLEVPPLWRGEDALYPVFLRTYKRAFSRALRQGVHGFTRVQTTAGIENYRMLGPSRIDALTLEADRELAAIEESYAFLLLVSPVNGEEAWEAFRRGGYEKLPELHYRLLPVDPDLLKRRLFAIPLEQVEDPAMAYLLRDKREELDRQISMLAERNTPDFRASSMRLYKAVDEPLFEAARDILDHVTIDGGNDGGDPTPVDAAAFAERARAEIAAYRSAWDACTSTVTIRDDLVGLMVSRGQLLIGHALRLRADRVEALIHHEVGTHVLTWVNGAAQPLHQLRHGLADYDELQEGLAVLAEYLVDGLSATRLRLLAARVLASHAMLEGATFIETFRTLNREHGFTASTAFGVASRVHQSGGFSRDMIYLRGLLRLMRHLADGGEIEPLYIGKIAAKHIPVIRELRERGVLVPPPLRPRFLEDAEVQRRLDAVREGLPVTQLVRGRTAPGS